MAVAYISLGTAQIVNFFYTIPLNVPLFDEDNKKLNWKVGKIVARGVRPVEGLSGLLPLGPRVAAWGVFGREAGGYDGLAA